MLEGLDDTALVLAVSRVKIIFDTIVAATWELFRDLSPSITEFLMQVKNGLFFFLVYRGLFNEWI